MKTQVMLDLETFGNKPGSVIVAIGAVTFSGNQIGSEFYRRIDARSCIEVGLKMDPETVLWWLKQSEAARIEITKGGDALAIALMDFRKWLNQQGAECDMWGNGSEFDNVLLAAAYDACQSVLPWKFWNNRCYRTVKNLFPSIPYTKPATAHNALEDAKAQAVHLMKIQQEKF